MIKNLDSIQNNAAIAIAETIRGTSSEIFQELGFESLKWRHRLGKLWGSKFLTCYNFRHQLSKFFAP